MKIRSPLKILDYYIIRNFLLTFLVIISIFTMIAVAFDFSEKIDDFLIRNAPFKKVIFDYYLNFIPYFLNLFSPLIIFISAVYFTSRMAYNTEFVAMFSAGINYYRLLVPYFIASFILALFSWVLIGYIIPKGNERLVEFESVYVNKVLPSDRGYYHRQIEPGTFIYMRNFNSNNNTGHRFSLEEFKGSQLKYKLMAQRAVWIDSLQIWQFENYTIRKINGLKESLYKGVSIRIPLSMRPSDFGQKIMDIQSMNNKQLSNFIKTERLRGEERVTLYSIERAKRTSMPMATFILVLIAVSLATRRIKGGIGWHLALGILIAFSYLFFMQFAVVFSINGSLNPYFSVWIPNIMYAVLGGVMLYYTPK